MFGAYCAAYLNASVTSAVAVADAFHPGRGAIRAVVADHLVDDVPRVDASLVVAGHRLDVTAQPLYLLYGTVGLSEGVGEEPGRRLVVPDERVADDEHLLPLAERDERVAGAEVVDARLRIDERRLEEVVRRDRVELADDERLRRRVGADRRGRVDGDAELECVAVGILQRRRGGARLGAAAVVRSATTRRALAAMTYRCMRARGWLERDADRPKKAQSGVKRGATGCRIDSAPMKPATHSFYTDAVQRVIEHVVSHLGEALALETLAEQACLSPFHFHRVFRGMVGETPLELVPRLRLERAAWRLLHTDAPVTAIAFDAGYETHEAFTRAFRASYADSPSGFRRRTGMRIELAAPNGVHFREDGAFQQFIPRDSGGRTMQVEIRQYPGAPRRHGAARRPLHPDQRGVRAARRARRAGAAVRAAGRADGRAVLRRSRTRRRPTSSARTRRLVVPPDVDAAEGARRAAHRRRATTRRRRTSAPTSSSATRGRGSWASGCRRADDGSATG